MTESLDGHRLYGLLPATYRIRDAEVGEPLAALLAILEEQLGLVADDLDRIYANWFIETCDDWVVPYIGDLVGYRLPDMPLEGLGTRTATRLTSILFPRSAVANLVRSRRRKGTLALLEELAADLADWPARAVETYRLLAVTQPVHLLGTAGAVPRAWSLRGGTAGLRDPEPLDLVDGPFDTLPRTVDVRRPRSHRTPGRHNLGSVAVHAWRLRSYSVTRSSALSLEGEDPHRFAFSIIGNDAPLFDRPLAHPSPTDVAREHELPVPIRRRALERGPERYLGEGGSIAVLIGSPPQPVPPEQIVAADLEDWYYRPRRDHVALDPERGRLLFAHNLLPRIREGVTVSYRYGFAGDIGGGEYERTLSAHPDAVIDRVQGRDALVAALAPWTDEGRLGEQPQHAVVEIDDSAVYDVALRIRLREGHSLQLRAASGRRPVLRLSDRSPGVDALRVTGEPGSALTLDGLWVVGNAVQVDGDLDTLRIRHCTLVPGWGLAPNCEPRHPARPGLELIDARPQTCIEHSIVGSLQVTLDRVAQDPVEVSVADSIVDATAPQRAAIAALGGGRAHADLCVVRTTVVGAVTALSMVLAENSIFHGPLDIARRQVGCVRFCSVRPDSRTPRRYRCQPDLVDEAVARDHTPGADRDRVRDRERLRVQPIWASLRYGTPDYGRLSEWCAPEITRGAEDESEMGVFHDLFQPQRTTTLQSALDDFTPADADAAVVFAS
jgi:hypothetical protein